MYTIVISIDCTPFASEIVLKGKELGEKYPGSEIILVHALPQPDYYFTAQYLPILGFNENYNKDLTRMIEGGELAEAIHSFMENLKEELNMPDIKSQIVDGDPEKVIPEIAHKLNADLIVMGKQKNDDENKNRLGHVTEAVLKFANLPVYVVPFKG